MLAVLLHLQRTAVNTTSVSAPLGEVPGPVSGVAGGCEGANLMRGRPPSSGVVPPSFEEDSPSPLCILFIYIFSPPGGGARSRVGSCWGL